MIWILWLLALLFASPAQAQCNGIFSPGAVCGNGGNYLGTGIGAPPRPNTFGSMGVGIQLNAADQTGITGCANASTSATNNQVAINCMITWLTSNVGGGSIYLPCGLYVLSATINMGNNQKLQGQQRDCVAIQTSTNLLSGDYTALKWANSSSNGTLEDVTVGCQFTAAPATNCVVVGTNDVVDMLRVRILGGLYGLENDGVDGVLVDLVVCGYSTVGAGGCVIENGGNWYFHASMDTQTGVGISVSAGWNITHNASGVTERSCSICDFSIGTSGTSILINDTAAHVYVSAGTLSAGLTTNGQWTSLTISELAGTLQNTGTGTLSIQGSWYNPGSSPNNVTGISTCSNNTGLTCGIPTASSCPGFAVVGDDRAGTITMTSATSCTINFGHTWSISPYCTVAPGSATSGVHLGISTTQLAVTFGTANTGFYYQCSGI